MFVHDLNIFLNIQSICQRQGAEVAYRKGFPLLGLKCSFEPEISGGTSTVFQSSLTQG